MHDRHRRDFLRAGLPALLLLPLGAGLGSRSAQGQPLPRLDPTSGPARALHYVERAEASEHPRHAAGQRCDNCLFYEADHQGCQIFPQHRVAPGGWCTSWSAARQ